MYLVQIKLFLITDSRNIFSKQLLFAKIVFVVDYLAIDVPLCAFLGSLSQFLVLSLRCRAKQWSCISKSQSELLHVFVAGTSSYEYRYSWYTNIG